MTRLLDLPPGAFRPLPKVHSAVVRLSFRPLSGADCGPDAVHVGWSAAMFTQRRKTLTNALQAIRRAGRSRSDDALVAAAGDRRPAPPGNASRAR